MIRIDNTSLEGIHNSKNAMAAATIAQLVNIRKQTSEIIKVKKILTLLFGNLDITKLIILLTLIYTFKNLYFIFYNFFLFKISNKIQLNLSLKLLNIYFQIPYIDFVKNQTKMINIQENRKQNIENKYFKSIKE